MAMDRAGFSEASITWARWVVFARDDRRRDPLGRLAASPAGCTDGKVALYAEERIPSLDGALMSAVEATSDSALPEEYRSSSLTSGLVDDAVRRLRPHGNGIAVEAPSIKPRGSHPGRSRGVRHGLLHARAPTTCAMARR